MRAKGMTYDTGFVYRGTISREVFDPAVVERELGIIRDDLHCNAVQLIGGDPARLELAGRLAAALGLEVWFSPYPLEHTNAEILCLFVDCAERAERLRQEGADVVFVAGVELSIMNRDFMPGDSVPDRLEQLLGEPDRRQEKIAEIGARLNEFLATAVAAIRERFRGRLTYCAVPMERIDWAPFDVVSLELIRSAAVAAEFRQGVRRLVAGGKPVAITGFGTAAYRGAGDKGGRFMEIVEADETTGAPLRLDGPYVRDEAGQAAYLADLLDIFQSEGVDSAFVFLFALESYPHRPAGDPRDDLDLASPSIVKVLEGRSGETYPDMAWEPKAAFRAVADRYRD
jgi:hypothetical protein